MVTACINRVARNEEGGKLGVIAKRGNGVVGMASVAPKLAGY